MGLSLYGPEAKILAMEGLEWNFNLSRILLPNPASIVSSRELRRGESDEEMHSCLPTLAESNFVETKAGSKSRFTSYKKPKYSEKRSVLDMWEFHIELKMCGRTENLGTSHFPLLQRVLRFKILEASPPCCHCCFFCPPRHHQKGGRAFAIALPIYFFCPPRHHRIGGRAFAIALPIYFPN